MTESFNSEINVGPPPVALPRRRRFGVIGIIAVLLLLGAGGGYLWLTYHETLTEMAHAVTGSTSGDGAQVIASTAAESGVSATDFAAFQQQTSSSIQTATDMLTAQQTELKRLSGQIDGLTSQLAGLTSKIDQLPGRPPAPQAAVPAAAPAPVAAQPVRPAPTAPRKRPVADKPAGAISVGGAPLPQPAR